MAGNWMKAAVKNPGGLHRALGVPKGKTIPAGRVAAAAKSKGHLGKMGRLAQTFARLRPNK